MSGGHFVDYSYPYYRVDQFADELESEVLNNNRLDENHYAPRFNDEVVGYLKSKIPELRKTAEIMRAIDYLYSGDHGEDSFMKVVQKIEGGG